MFKQKLSIFLLFVIILLGTFLRFYKLGEIPNSLNWDEVSWGYNAYSILETGKDEYAEFMPLSFQAFGDYKQPVYVYLQVPAINVFGLNAFAVRFPSALFGSMSILFVYLLVYELFRKWEFGNGKLDKEVGDAKVKSYFSIQNRASHIALLTSFFYAISPWSIQFSRVAFEANIGLFFVIVGAWLFVRGLNTQKIWYLFGACIPLGISAHSYHSEKLFTPVFFVGFLLLGYSIFIRRKKLAIAIILFFILCNILWLADPRTTRRGRSVTFTSQQTQILQQSTEKIDQDKSRGDFIGVLSHNRRVVYAQKYIDNYLKHFDLNYLFVKGDNARHHAPGMGVLYLINLPFIIYGIISVIAKKINRIWFVFFWLLLAPGASALAVDAPNASRSLIILPTWDVLAAFGWYFAFEKLTNVKFGSVIKLGLVLLLIANFYYYLIQYFTLTNYEYSEYWQYGYKEVVEQTKYTNNHIFYTNDLEQPYIFCLFYNQYSPQKYQSQGGSNRIHEKCFQIENSFFGLCNEYVKTEDFIISKVVDETTQPTNTTTLIQYPNGKNALKVVRKTN